jgi:hypothetical protein
MLEANITSERKNLSPPGTINIHVAPNSIIFALGDLGANVKLVQGNVGKPLHHQHNGCLANPRIFYNQAEKGRPAGETALLAIGSLTIWRWKMTYLSKLKFTNVARKSTVDPIIRRREKLLEKLDEQKQAAQHAIDGKVYTPTKRGWITDDETGEKRLVEKPKKVRAWFWESAGDWYFQVRYGAKLLELANGKSSIEVGDKGKLIDVIDLCISAVKEGELDKQLTEIAAMTKTRLRKSKAA